MGTYKTVGMSNEPHQPLEHPPLVPFVAVPGNHTEVGVAVEREALANATAQRHESRATGKPFTTPSPKVYAHMEADANPAPLIQKFGE